MFKKLKKISRKEKIILIVFMVVLIILILNFGIQLYLYINVITGNDIVLTANVNEEHLFLENGVSKDIIVESKIIANPFCSAICTATFKDLSRENFIDNETFKMSISKPFKKSYNIIASEKGVGQELYQFSVSCNGINNLFCKVDSSIRKRVFLITVDYDLSEENKKIQEDSKFKFIDYSKRISFISANLDEILKIISKLNLVNFSSFDENIQNLQISSFETYLNNSKEAWENYRFEEANKILDENYNKINKIEDDFYKINKSFYSNISLYNNLIKELNDVRNDLNSFNGTLVTLDTSNEINKTIRIYEEVVERFKTKNLISDKSFSIDLDYIKIKILEDINNGENLDYLVNIELAQIDEYLVYFNEISFNYIGLNEIKPMCCLYSDCNECYDNEENSSKYLPVVLLHGHNFNEKVSAEESLSSFNSIQGGLEKEGYLNAGSLLISELKDEEKGVYGKINTPISVKTSYYFDLFLKEGGGTLIQTKTDNIDTYAVRLKDSIDAVKFLTGKDEVIIVAHSMGGLVARRYLQLFGSEDVNKLIMIGTPNNGLEGRIASFCSLIGSNEACDDMQKDSLFINKLNHGKNPNIDIFNIVGIGCNMEGKEGDGIVTKDSAEIGWSENFYINGYCNDIRFIFLHSDLLNIEKYPEVYDVIIKVIKK